MNTLNELELPEDQDLIEADNTYWKDMAEALDRLHSNADFKKVVLEGYFKDRAVDHVSMLANEGVIRRNERPSIMERLVAISHLQDYFIMINQLSTSFDDHEEQEEA